MKWKVPKIWKNKRVFIIGGGPSLTEEFGIPQEVVKQVKNGGDLALYSPYMEAIHNKPVIAVNAAFLIGNWPDMVFFGDKKFYKWYEDELRAYPKPVVTCHGSFLYKKEFRYLKKDPDKQNGLTDNPWQVSWNNNSGAAAINVAANAGASEIVLIGFDMKLVNKEKHWHSEYKQKDDTGPKKKSFGRHLRGFSAIKRDADKHGIKIINASPDSAIKEFEKVSLKDIL